MKPNRVKGTFNALIAVGALFCAVFVLLAVQMVLGNDPAIGTTRGATTKASVTKEKSDEKSLLEKATDALDIQSPPDDQYYEQAPQQQYYQPSQQAPAPVQSSSS